MLVLKLLLQVLAVAAALITSTMDYVAHDKRTRRFKRLRLALYVVVLVTLAAGIIVTVADERSKRHEIAELKTALGAATTAARAATGATTGGDSFPYVNIVGDSILLINEGSNPLYDLSLRMWDPEDYLRPLTSQQFWNLERTKVFHFSLPSFPPESAQQIGTITFPDDSVRQRFAVALIARNGSFSEQLEFRKVDGEWRGAYRVSRDRPAPNVQLLQRSDPEFPRESSGEPIRK